MGLIVEVYALKMTKQQIEILEAARTTVTGIIQRDVPPLFVFHNVQHTQDVADAAQLLLSHHQVSEMEEFAVIVSAWFHDTGFSAGRIEGHEGESIRLAKEFLNRHSVGEESIGLIEACINATRMPQQPTHLAHKILCDADLYHIGTNRYPEWNSLLKKELINYHQKILPEEEWRKQNIAFLSEHRFCTAYAQQTLEPVKQEWVKKLSESTRQTSHSRI